MANLPDERTVALEAEIRLASHSRCAYEQRPPAAKHTSSVTLAGVLLSRTQVVLDPGPGRGHHRYADADGPGLVPCHWRKGGPIELAGDTLAGRVLHLDVWPLTARSRVRCTSLAAPRLMTVESDEDEEEAGVPSGEETAMFDGPS